MEYCVYKHTAPDGRVYIGITSQKPQVRWQGGNGYKNNSYFTRTIKKYGWENFNHEIIKTGLPEGQAKAEEIRLIALYKSNIRKYGFNISSGGESKKGTTISDWHKEQISKASKGRIVSEDTRKKLSKASKATWQNEAYRNHMREINTGANNKRYGHKTTDNEKIIRGAKSVLQYNISIHNANEITGISRDSISKCCKGIFRQAGGYIWKFKND